jgi:hypothetical protein
LAFDDLTQLAVVQSLKANSYSHTGGSPAGEYAGTSVATSQHHRLLMLVNVGTAGSGSRFTVKLQESDDDSTWTDVSGATTGTLLESSGGDDSFYFGGVSTQKLKKYVRAYLVVQTAAVNVGVQLALQPRDSADSSTAIFNI